MNKYLKIILLFFITISIQILTYTIFIKDHISAWGSNKEEQILSLKGDEIAPYIISTRAININSTNIKVWNTLSKLGADREGFFAYSFIEELLGYKTIKNNEQLNHSMNIGRSIPTTIEKNEKYSFQIVDVKYGNYFVLKNWGTFFIKETKQNQTKLIVRSHGHTENKNDIQNLLFEPMHYIMERRMMIGIKAESENYKISEFIDFLWLFSIIFTALGILYIMFSFFNIISICMTIILSNIWLYCLLVFNPLSYSSLILFIVVCLTYILLKRYNNQKSQYI